MKTPKLAISEDCSRPVVEELLILFYTHIFKKVLSVVSPGHYLQPPDEYR